MALSSISNISCKNKVIRVNRFKRSRSRDSTPSNEESTVRGSLSQEESEINIPNERIPIDTLHINRQSASAHNRLRGM